MREVELQDVAEIIAGQSPKSEFYNEDGEGVPFFQGKTDFGEDYPTVTTWCTKPKKMAKEGDILFSVRAPVGPTNIAKVDCCIGRGLSAIRPKEEINRSYLRFYFKKVEEKIADQGRGSTFKAITQKDLKALKIPLPSLSEQKAIVAKLDRAQRLIDIDKEMLAKYDELIQSVFLEMFGDPVTNPKGWEKKSLKELGDIQTGKTPSTKVKEYFEGDIPFVTPSDLGENSITPTRFLSKDGLDNSRKVRKGTTLVCCIGATIGKIGMTEKMSGFNQQINSIEWNKDFVLDEVGYQGMRFFKDEIKSNAKSTTLPILKKSLFEDLKFPVFEKGLQEKFLDIYHQIKLQKEKTEISLKKSEELFSSLVQEAFG